MISVFVAAALCGVLASDHGTTTAGAEVGRLTERMAGKKWEQRSTAFYDLLRMGQGKGDSKKGDIGLQLASLINEKCEDAPAIRRALIELLAIENDHVGHQADLSGEFTDYYGDLISAVTSLKDPRSVKSLAGALGSGTMVVRTLVELGQPSVDPVLERLEGGGELRVNHSACMVLRMMLRPTNPNPISDPKRAKRIQEALNRKPCKN